MERNLTGYKQWRLHLSLPANISNILIVVQSNCLKKVYYAFVILKYIHLWITRTATDLTETLLFQATKKWKLNVNKHDWQIDTRWPEDPSEGYFIFVNKKCEKQKEKVYICT